MMQFVEKLESGFMLILMFYVFLAGLLGLLFIVIVKTASKPLTKLYHPKKNKKPNVVLKILFLPFWLIVECMRLTKHVFLRLPYRVRQALFIIAFLIFIAGITQAIFKPKSTQAAWYNDYWGYRKSITLTVSSSASDITNLETLLTVDTTGITSKLQTNCEDLRFTNQSGNILPYYIDTCTDNSATNKIWVLVDLVPKNTTTYTLYMYYGNPSAASASNSELFYRVRGLIGYWTSNETSWNGTAGEVKDSSSNGNNGVRSGNATTTSSGQYSYAGDYDGTGDYVSVSSFDETVTAATITAWIYVDAMSSYDGLVFSRGTNVTGMNINTAGTGLGYHWNDASNTYTWASGLTIPTGSWVFVAIAVNSSEAKAYLGQSGTLSSATNSVSHSSTQINDLKFATDDAGSRDLDGRIDDIRIYNRKLSTGEITSLYSNPGTIATTATTTSQPSTSFATEEKSPGPVGWWKLDEATGSSTNDGTANNNIGTITGATWQTPNLCVSVNCLRFDGSGDQVSVTSSPSLSITGALTISAWVKMQSTAIDERVFVSKWNSGTDQRGFALSISGTDQVCLTIDQDGASGGLDSGCSTQSLAQNTWYHMTAVYTPSTSIDIYIDGKINGSNTSSIDASIFNSSANFILGGSVSGWSGQFTGFLDDVKVYNFARSADQIKLDYNAGRGADETPKGAHVLGASQFQNDQVLSDGLTGYWKMDQSSWNGTSDEVTDSSGNGNDGTRAGDATTAVAKFNRGGTFDGTGDYVTMGDISNTYNSNGFTWAIWIKPSNVTSTLKAIMAKFDQDGANPGVALGISTTGKVVAHSGCSGTPVVTSNTTLSTGNWYHLALVGDSSDFSIYINGQLENKSHDCTPDLGTNTNEFRLASNQDGGYSGYNGLQDEARIYSRKLNDAEVSLLYNFAPGPVAYWQMEEATGSRYDSSSNGYTLSEAGGTVNSSPGKYGKAAYINAATTQTYLTRSDTADLSMGNIDFTVSTWAKFTSLADHRYIVFKGTADTTGGLEYRLIYNVTNNDFEFSVSNGTTLSTATSDGLLTPATNQWYYLTGWYDSVNDVVGLNVNGSIIDTTSNTTGSQDTAGAFDVGSKADASHMYGEIDEVKVYRYVRSSKQIVEDMNAGHPLGGSPVGTQFLYWKLNEGYGTSAYDSSINYNTGTLSGFASPSTSTSGWTNSGKYDKGLVFDGLDDYVYRSSFASSVSSDVTVSLWFKADTQSANARLFDLAQASASGLNVRLNTDGSLTLDNDGGVTNAISKAGMDDDAWHQVVVVRNGTTYSMYVDGVLVGTSPGTLVTYTQVFIGRRQSAGSPLYFTGKLDDIKIYSGALTQAEILVDYNQSQALVLGALGNNSNHQTQANSQLYCVPGDSSTCTSPVLEWKFEESQGTTANDTSGKAITGTWAGTVPYWTVGKYGGGGNTNGTNSYVSNASSAPTTSTTTWTLEGWINPSQLSVLQIAIYNGNDTGGYGFGIGNGTGGTGSKLQGLFGSVDWLDSGYTFPSANRWYHVAMTRDGTTTTFYVDGVKTANTSALTPGSVASKFSVGMQYNTSNVPARFFSGKTDEVKVFDYARTPAQIAYDYNRGLPQMHWKLDECQGTIANDSSGNLFAGTLTPGASGQTSVGTCTESANTMWYDGRNGKYNSSLEFDGTDDYVTINSPSFQTATSGSLSFWAYINSVSADDNLVFTLTDKDTDAQDEWDINFLTTIPNSVRIVLRETGSVTQRLDSPANSFAEDTWVHVVVTSDGSFTRMYVNGKEVFLTVTTGSNNGDWFGDVSNIDNLSIGGARRSSGVGAPFPGQIDDVKIFNYTLTASQVKTLFNQNAAVQWAPISGIPQ